MNPPTIAQHVTDELRSRIVRGDLKPGTRLKDEEVANALGVSATPVRHALHRLADEGLVKVTPHRGACVKELTLEDAVEMTQVREALEALAFRLVAPVITDADLARTRELHQTYHDACVDGNPDAAYEADVALHDHVIELAHNHWLSDFGRKLSVVQIMWLRFARPRLTREDRFRDRDCHLGLVEGLASRNPDIAEAALRRHVSGTHEDLMRWRRESEARQVEASALRGGNG